MLKNIRQKKELLSKNRSLSFKRRVELENRLSQDLRRLQQKISERSQRFNLRKSAQSQQHRNGGKIAGNKSDPKFHPNKDSISREQIQAEYYGPTLQRNSLVQKSPKNLNSLKNFFQSTKEPQKQQQPHRKQKKTPRNVINSKQFNILQKKQEKQKPKKEDNYGLQKKVRVMKISDIIKKSPSEPYLQQYWVSEQALEKIHKADLKFQIERSKQRLVSKRMNKRYDFYSP